MPPRPFHNRPEEIILHCVPASQYSTKVLAGLESRGLKHFVEFAAPIPSNRRLPTGNKAVPELEYKGQGVADSSRIFAFLDQYLPEGVEKFFPDGPQLNSIKETEKEIEEYLDAFVDYYNYIDKEGYERSVRQSLARYIPWWAFWVNIDSRLKGKREQCERKCDEAFKRFNGSSKSSDSHVRPQLFALLTKYAQLFESDTQQYLFNTTLPSAADLALYSKLCRLMDKNGDVSIGAAFPDLIEADPSMQRLVPWFSNMQSLCPLQWKGKRLL